ncbi:MAG TPA: hypothetical protein VFX44_08860 [Solirubrobacterales bacterium]|nr:hypothetical protein [Solirubrobacterales bacterium]
MCLGVLLALPMLAQADTGNIIEPNTEPPNAANGWQAATCKTDEPVGGEPKIHCSPQTPGAFYTLAGGHPPIGFTQYIIKHKSGTGKVEPAGIEVPTAEVEDPAGDQSIKTLRVDLPPGLTVNPNATPKCSLAEFENKIGEFHVPACKEGTIVGREEITLVTTVAGVPAPSPPFPSENTLPKGFIIPPSEKSGTKVPVYNLQPKPGEPALFGFVAAGKEVVFLETEVSWQNDFHESFTIQLPKQEPPFATLISRLVNFGQEAGNQGLVKEGNGTYINNPTTCFDPNQFPTLYSTWFRAHSYGEEDPEFPFGSTPFEAKVESSTGELIQQEGCDTVPFGPGVEVEPGTKEIDSPAAPTVNTTLEYLTGEESEQQESHLRKAAETLPAGMGLNPSGAQGLKACTDAQFKKGVRTYENECPAESKVGTVEIESPPLERALTGDVYVGEQKSRDPQSGEEFRILVEAKEEEEGIDARLVGNVKADPNTGQLTAVFNEQQVGELAGKLPEGLPQVPFTSVKIHFDKAKAVLTSPPTCSPATTTGEMTPWARPDEVVKISSEPFTLSSDPNGGSCPKTLAERKFVPSYKAVVESAQGGAFSPFHVQIARTDGQQELKAVNVTLPKGLTGKLAGIPYCSEAAIVAAAANSGKAELASPSCSAESQIGTVETVSGTGSNPLKLGGKAYLAGPYKGAPLSMVTVTPAVAGPFDLGTVVVRVALNVNPETAQINAVSDVIPDVFGGVKLDLRSIVLNVDRHEFMVNPTNCAAQATTGTINGGGADPTNPAAFSSYPVNDPFQATGCNSLGFKPKLKVQLFGPTKRSKNPRLKATLTARKGDANIARTALTMPHSLFLDQSHIGTVCTRPQLASHTCPKASVYGNAEASSPLLSGKLKGQVYLVSSNHHLPDLLADLRGQVEIYLRGVISSKHGGLKTVFNNTPDVPVSKVVLNMKGGKKSLLVNSTNTCAKPQRAVLNIGGQNGKKVKNNKFKLNIKSCKGKKGNKHHK